MRTSLETSNSSARRLPCERPESSTGVDDLDAPDECRGQCCPERAGDREVRRLPAAPARSDRIEAEVLPMHSVRRSPPGNAPAEEHMLSLGAVTRRRIDGA